jgi:hypothetical protein
MSGGACAKYERHTQLFIRVGSVQYSILQPPRKRTPLFEPHFFGVVQMITLAKINVSCSDSESELDLKRTLYCCWHTPGYSS